MQSLVLNALGGVRCPQRQFYASFFLTQKLPVSRGESTSSLRHKESSEANMSAIS